MNILIIGSGGREQAISWAIRKDDSVKKIFIAPGNGGSFFMKDIVENVPINPYDDKKIVAFVRERNIDYVIVGPEQPLAKGLVNELEKANIRSIGPTKEAAQLETSKSFAKEVMKQANIPTADFNVFNDYRKARDFIFSVKTYPIVIKASGLASGKGVIICEDQEHALRTLELIFHKKIFGDSGNTVVIESFLEGEEASIFALTDGKSYLLFPNAQDHKRIGENDTGKNTGGMGAYSPAPIVNEHVIKNVRERIIEPLLEEMNRRGIQYKGFLYVGLMIKNNDPSVVEFNARFGDPEAQVVLPLLETSLQEIFQRLISNSLHSNLSVTISPKVSSTVVMASGGYPEHFEKNKPIISSHSFQNDRYSDVRDDTMIFHSGTYVQEGKVFSSGGRVLSISSVAGSLEKSLKNCYSAISNIHFEKAYFRKDIGQKAFKHLIR